MPTWLRGKLRLTSRALDTALSHSSIELYRSSLSFGRSRCRGCRSLIMFAPAQQILRKSDEALYVALQLPAVHQGLLQLVRQIGWCEIETPPCPVAKADQLFVRDVRQSDDAVMQTVLGQPGAPILN